MAKTSRKMEFFKSRRKNQKVAVFDIDGTIFRSSLLIEITEALILENIFPVGTKKMYEKEQKEWINRKGTYDKYIWAVIKAFYKNIKGVKEKDFLPVVKKMLSFHQNRVYRYTRDLVKDLKSQKCFLLAISHSPLYMVRKFAEDFGFDKIYGTLLELDRDKRFTGKIPYYELIMDKAKILKRAIEKENLNLKGSIGVGDSESDIPFLKLVEKPICFNPNTALYKVAKKNGWQVVVERKDMIYRINSKLKRQNPK